MSDGGGAIIFAIIAGAVTAFVAYYFIGQLLTGAGSIACEASELPPNCSMDELNALKEECNSAGIDPCKKSDMDALQDRCDATDPKIDPCTLEEAAAYDASVTLQAACDAVDPKIDPCTQEALDAYNAGVSAAAEALKDSCLAHELDEDCEEDEITAMEATCAGMNPAPVECKFSVLPSEEV